MAPVLALSCKIHAVQLQLYIEHQQKKSGSVAIQEEKDQLQQSIERIFSRTFMHQ